MKTAKAKIVSLRRLTKAQIIRRYRKLLRAERKENTRLNRFLDGARVRAQHDVINNEELVAIVRKLERLILEQSVQLSQRGLSQYALPPISCFKSVFPELFSPLSSQSKPQTTTQHVIR